MDMKLVDKCTGGYGNGIVKHDYVYKIVKLSYLIRY